MVQLPSSTLVLQLKHATDLKIGFGANWDNFAFPEVMRGKKLKWRRADSYEPQTRHVIYAWKYLEKSISLMMEKLWLLRK